MKRACLYQASKPCIITEREKTTELLEKSKESLIESEIKYRDLVENSPDAIAIYEEGKIIFVNKECLHLMAAACAEELIGKPVMQFVHPDYRELVIERMQSLSKEGFVLPLIEEKFVRLDGSEVDVEVKAMPISFRNKQAVQLIVRDITERKLAEERLKEQADAMEATIDGLAILNADMKYNYLNKAHAEIYGYDNVNELIGLSWRVLYDTDELQRIEREIMPKLINNGYYQGSAVGKKKDGSKFPQAISLTFLGNGGLVCIVRDITDRQRAENEIIKAKEKAEESDRLKSAFLANMSHEIRTPMNGILGFAELLKEPDLTTEKQQEYLSIIKQSGVRMLSIINDIIDISKIESGLMNINVKESNVNEQIEYIYTFFRPEIEGRGIRFFFQNSLPSKKSIIRTDREKVYAILINLVKNAIKFTNIGSIEFGYEKKGEFLEFFVKDTGKGIPQEQREIIFERFRQGSVSLSRNYEGAGLGLSISKAYVEMLGGKIWVESKERKGSAFYFTIPYNTESEGIIETKNVVFADRTDNQIKPIKILIAEDNEASVLFIEMAVKRFSKVILEVRTGFEAVKACRNNPDIDLVLMDIKMPEMDGYEATRKIRQFNKDVIIIAQTAYTLTGDKEKAIEAGCNDYISKPIKKDELIVLIRKYFN